MIMIMYNFKIIKITITLVIIAINNMNLTT